MGCLLTSASVRHASLEGDCAYRSFPQGWEGDQPRGLALCRIAPPLGGREAGAPFLQADLCVTSGRESKTVWRLGTGKTTSSFPSPSGAWLHLLFVGLALILYFFPNEGFSDLPNLRFYPTLLMNEK